MNGSIDDVAPWLLPLFATLFGLVWGSFLNVVIHRLPLRQSLVTPRSRCPSCGKPVASYDNVPVLSYVWLGGRCRHCKAGISARYPLVELAVGGASLASFVRHGPSLEYLVELGFVAAMIALVFIDFDHKILPDAVTYPGIALGLALSVLRESIGFWDSLGGAVLGAGLLWGVSKAYYFVRKEEGLGFGDVKMMGMVGAFLGWRGVLLTLFLGSLSGSVIGVLVLAFQGGTMKSKLPFGTFLGIGAIFTLYAGGPLIDWYSGLF